MTNSGTIAIGRLGFAFRQSFWYRWLLIHQFLACLDPRQIQEMFVVELHENTSADDLSTEDDARNAKNGLILFAVYVLIYGAFVGLNTFAPDLMGAPMAGLNLAIIYGFGLIIAALVLAAIYGVLCRSSADSTDVGGQQ